MVENPRLVELARLAALAPEQIPAACGVEDILAAARRMEAECQSPGAPAVKTLQPVPAQSGVSERATTRP